MELLNKINHDGLAVLKSILGARGDLGIDNYYEKRFLKDEFINDLDIKIISYIDKNISKELSIFEPGSGYSQIPIALSILGYKSFALEVREDRYNGSLYAKKEFSRLYSNLDNLKIIRGRYPSDAPDCDILLTRNFASTFNRENETCMINTFKNFKYSFVDAKVFGFKRGEDDILHLLGKMNELGFSYKLCFDDYYLVEAL